MKRKQNNMKSSNGSALILVILLMALTTILSSALITLTYSNFKVKTNEADSYRAFYIGEACLEKTRSEVILRLQTFINGGETDSSYAARFSDFLRSLESIAREVPASQSIQQLDFDSLEGSSRVGNNSIHYSYTVRIGVVVSKVSAEYIFDDPESFGDSRKTIDKVMIIWGK